MKKGSKPHRRPTADYSLCLKQDPAEPASLDPLGSYTGRCADPEEQPVQDADDL